MRRARPSASARVVRRAYTARSSPHARPQHTSAIGRHRHGGNGASWEPSSLVRPRGLYLAREDACLRARGPAHPVGGSPLRYGARRIYLNVERERAQVCPPNAQLAQCMHMRSAYLGQTATADTTLCHRNRPTRNGQHYQLYQWPQDESPPDQQARSSNQPPAFRHCMLLCFPAKIAHGPPLLLPTARRVFVCTALRGHADRPVCIVLVAGTPFAVVFAILLSLTLSTST